MILMVFPHWAVADTALVIRGGGHSDPEIRGRGSVSNKYFFGPLGLNFGLKIKGRGGGGGRAPPLDPPLLIQQLCKFLVMNERV